MEFYVRRPKCILLFFTCFTIQCLITLFFMVYFGAKLVPFAIIQTTIQTLLADLVWYHFDSILTFLWVFYECCWPSKSIFKFKGNTVSSVEISGWSYPQWKILFISACFCSIVQVIFYHFETNIDTNLQTDHFMLPFWFKDEITQQLEYVWNEHRYLW